MLVCKNNGYYHRYTYGGGSVFTTLSDLFSRAIGTTITKEAVKNIGIKALDIGKSAVKDLGSKAIMAGKSAARDLSKKAIESGKVAAIEAGKKFIEKSVTKALTPSSQKILEKYAGVSMEKTSPDSVARNFNTLLEKYINESTKQVTEKVASKTNGKTNGKTVNNVAVATPSLSSLIRGSAIGGTPTIRDLVKRLNGGGLKKV